MYLAKDVYETYNEYLGHWNLFGGKTNTLYKVVSPFSILQRHFIVTYYRLKLEMIIIMVNI